LLAWNPPLADAWFTVGNISRKSRRRIVGKCNYLLAVMAYCCSPATDAPVDQSVAMEQIRAATVESPGVPD